MTITHEHTTCTKRFDHTTCATLAVVDLVHRRLFVEVGSVDLATISQAVSARWTIEVQADTSAELEEAIASIGAVAEGYGDNTTAAVELVTGDSTHLIGYLAELTFSPAERREDPTTTIKR